MDLEGRSSLSMLKVPQADRKREKSMGRRPRPAEGPLGEQARLRGRKGRGSRSGGVMRSVRFSGGFVRAFAKFRFQFFPDRQKGFPVPSVPEIGKSPWKGIEAPFGI